jgi:hypothetical protein
MKIFLWVISCLLILAGIIVSWIYFANLPNQYTHLGDGETFFLDKSGQVGDFIGGIVGTIFSLAGFIILIITLSSQTQSAYLEQFESKFFELIRMHRENVSEMNIKRKAKGEDGSFLSYQFKDRQAFKIILSDFTTCRNDMRQYFSKFQTDDIYESGYLQMMIKALNVDQTHIRLKSIARIDIAYCITFYGVGSEGLPILKNLFQKKYNPKFYTDLLRYISMKPIASSSYWDNWKKFGGIKKMAERILTVNEIFDLRKNKSSNNSHQNSYYYDNNFIKYYGGHQHRLGHYYRHLFQTVKFVNLQTRLSFQQKYFYVKTLRAQLSSYEQALLFINSLSMLGHAWELLPKFEKSKSDKISKKRLSRNRLITNYNLIKNVPGENIFGISYTHYYPEVNYEIFQTSSNSDSE